MRTGALGFWSRSVGGQPSPREPLSGDAEADVAIVGAGYTGLWTAYYLKRARPSLRIVVLEAERAGFGASGRNGGWVSGFFSGPARVYERRGGRAGYVALQREMFATVREVGAVLERERIEAEFFAGGRRKPRRWEPEPLRWASIRGVYSLYRVADRNELRGGSASRLGRLVDLVSGRRRVIR
jgi:glycine/D-amino acid oxidase-like deaminating enzyme